jgi:hypothetical protein
MPPPDARSSNGAEAHTTSKRPPVLFRLVALALLAIAGAVYPKLSFPAVFFCLVGLVATPKLEGRARVEAWVLLAISVIATAVGLLRFVLHEAIPGVLAGGKAAIEKQAIAFSRTVVAAEDHARRAAYHDPDGDGVGSALSLLELAGFAALPAGSTLAQPPLALRREDLRETAGGLAVHEAGYLVMICLPQGKEAFSSDPEKRDAERAELEYRIYAWPEALGAGSPRTTYFLDAGERILHLDAPANDEPAYVGATRPPPCDSVSTHTGWQQWKDKAPRAKLPGAPVGTGARR